MAELNIGNEAVYSDVSLQNEEAAQACFDFKIFLTTGWLHRRVESWEYAKDSQWRVKLSLDIDMARVDQMFEETVVNSLGSWSSASKVVDIPLLHVRKSAQFADFSVCDRRNQSMRLLLREMGCHVALNQLEGAILTVHGSKRDFYGEDGLAPLSQKPELSKLLAMVFKEPLSPTRDDGGAIELGDPDVYCSVKKYILRIIGSLSEDPEWTNNLAEKVEVDFCKYWDCSRVFRYFVTLNSLRWLACVRVDLGSDDFSILKVTYLTARDIVGEVKRSSYRRTLGSGRMALDVELDGLGVGEVGHVMIHAPAGTRFTPSKPKEEGFGIGDFFSRLAERVKMLGKPEGETSEGQSGGEKSKYFIIKRLFEASDEDKGGIPPEAIAYGFLTPTCASLKGQMGWFQYENDGDDVIDMLYRRVPVFDSHAGIYTMCLGLAPRLGAKSLGYLAYFAFSFLVMLAGVCIPDLFNNNDTSEVLTVLFALAPIVVAILVGSNEEPFISRRLFRTPYRLSCVCTCINVMGLLVLVMEITKLLPFELCFSLWMVDGLFAAVLLVVLVVYSVWLVYYRLKERWTSKKGAYGVLDIPIYVEKR